LPRLCCNATRQSAQLHQLRQSHQEDETCARC
jgi:hypothetical protein